MTAEVEAAPLPRGAYMVPVERYVVFGPAPFGGTYYAAGATIDEVRADAERVARNMNETAEAHGLPGRARIEHRAAAHGPVLPGPWADLYRAYFGREV